MRYKLFCTHLQQSLGLRGDQPMAQRAKLAELKPFVEQAIESGYGWHIIDNTKPNDWVERETVFSVCGIVVTGN
jgi:hypothetical protein